MDGFALQAGDWAFVWSNAGVLLQGFMVTVLLTASSIALGFLAGFPAGAVEVYGRGPLRWLVRSAGVLLRGTPIVVIIVVFFFGLPLPDPGDIAMGGVRIGGIPIEKFTVSFQAFLAATLALGLRSAAYQSQVFRGAIQSVDEGQVEAARSIGLSQFEAVLHVVVPQALRRSVPGFQNEFTIVLKDTSIAFAIGLAELLTRGFELFTQPGHDTAVLEVILAISAIYFVLTFTTNRALDALDDRFAIPTGES
jgi:polar amino acid transport system permease protein